MPHNENTRLIKTDPAWTQILEWTKALNKLLLLLCMFEKLNRDIEDIKKKKTQTFRVEINNDSDKKICQLVLIVD